MNSEYKQLDKKERDKKANKEKAVPIIAGIGTAIGVAWKNKDKIVEYGKPVVMGAIDIFKNFK